MATYPFGNDPAKIAGYKAFWKREDVTRPLIGFSIKSWFPLEEFEASRAWQSQSMLTHNMVQPQAFMDDRERLLLEGEKIDDDILRGHHLSRNFHLDSGRIADVDIRIHHDDGFPEEESFGTPYRGSHVLCLSLIRLVDFDHQHRTQSDIQHARDILILKRIP